MKSLIGTLNRSRDASGACHARGREVCSENKVHHLPDGEERSLERGWETRGARGQRGRDRLRKRRVCELRGAAA